MKFLQFYKEGIPTLAVKTEAGIVDLSSAPGMPKTMKELCELPDVNSALAEIESFCAKARGGALLNEAEIKFAPVVTGMEKIVCIGLNYIKHAEECHPGQPLPTEPTVFAKFGNALAAHGMDIKLPQSKCIDYEAELVVVIGKRGTYIPEEEALDHVFGYTIGNDISARDVQNRHVNWFMGKSLTTHCPVGPWIVTKEEIPDPQCLSVRSYVEGELRQDGNTRDMIRGVARIIHELSQGYELFPGDMIMTGTPKGVGMGFKPPRYLQPGNEVKCVIDQIGELTNYLEK